MIISLYVVRRTGLGLLTRELFFSRGECLDAITLAVWIMKENACRGHSLLAVLLLSLVWWEGGTKFCAGVPADALSFSLSTT